LKQTVSMFARRVRGVPRAHSTDDRRGKTLGGFMASGAKNQLPLVNVLGAPTVGDGSVGRWDGKESFFPDGFDVGGHP
jgi:hypothetical protein